MKQYPNGWWIEEGARLGKTLNDAKKRVSTMWVCDYCERVYCDPVHGLGLTVQEFFENVPTYGKPHKTCDTCFQLEQENDGISWFYAGGLK